MCECQVCKDLKHLRECEVSPDFIDRYLDEGLNAEYNQSVLSGDWSSSVEILEKALQKAKEKRNESLCN